MSAGQTGRKSRDKNTPSATVTSVYVGCGGMDVADGPLPIGDVVGVTVVALVTTGAAGYGIYQEVKASSISVSKEEEKVKVYGLFWRWLMIINAANGEMINSKEMHICMHDDIFEEMSFFRDDRRLYLSGKKSEWEAGSDDMIFSMNFMNVIGFEMTSCDFWGMSPHIFSFYYVETNENIIIPKLFKEKNDNNYEYSSLKEPEKYFESEISFISGDRLRVACESIDYQVSLRK